MRRKVYHYRHVHKHGDDSSFSYNHKEILYLAIAFEQDSKDFVNEH